MRYNEPYRLYHMFWFSNVSNTELFYATACLSCSHNMNIIQIRSLK